MTERRGPTRGEQAERERQARDARVAAIMRANLRKRKAQELGRKNVDQQTDKKGAIDDPAP